MKIDKAIEQLHRGTKENRNTNNQILREAMQLGIEALKVVKDNRDSDRAIYIRKLPGETKE